MGSIADSLKRPCHLKKLGNEKTKARNSTKTKCVLKNPSNKGSKGKGGDFKIN